MLELVTEKCRGGTKFSYVIVSKKINSKFMLQPDEKIQAVENPQAGTVVDTVVVSVPSTFCIIFFFETLGKM